MPISRYNNLSILTDKNIKKRYETFPKVDKKKLQSNTDIIIEIKDGDRLDALAAKYLGSGSYWWVISMYNDIKIPIGNEIYPGRKIRIPNNIELIINAINKGL